MKSLRTQTLLYLLLLMAVVGLVSYLAGVHVMNASMANYEDRLAGERYTRVVQATESAAHSLQRSAGANAIWNDARDFMNGALPDHLEGNYQRGALDTYGTDFVLFVKPDGTLHAAVDGRGDNIEFLTGQDGRFAPLVTEINARLDALTRLGGYMIRPFGGQPVMMSYAGITSSDPSPSDPVAGWLMFCRIMDQDTIASINQSAGAVASVFPSGEAVSGLDAATTGLLKDSFGDTGLTLASDAAPSMDGQRNVSQSMMAFNTIILVILAALAVSVLLDRLVLRRLAHFSELAQRQQAGITQGDAVVWPVRDSDELDTLAISLNGLVDNLRAAEHTLRDEQAEIIEAKRKLEVANRMKDTFLATISHELRTPMNGIIGAFELLKTSSPTPYQKECLDTLRESSTHMLSMVERILLFSELQSGSVRKKPQTIHLEQWSDLMRRVWAINFRQKKLPFTLTCDNIVEPWISVDAAKIDQFVQELLRNAEKFTSEGSVSMRISQTQADAKLFLDFEVRDTGSGIAADQLDHIAESFRRTEGRYSRGMGGLGIGLAITKEIVHVMDGEWHIQSEGAGKGTVITATIPVEKAEPLVHEAPKPAPVAAGNGRFGPGRILLVEDNPVNQKVMIKILEMLGWPYRLAENGEEAVRYASEEAYSLILMDCQMPVMDGLEATKVIRATNNPNQLTPIIAVTANVSDLDRDNCMAVGMNAYLPKPVKPAVIKEAISSWAAIAKAREG